jgi:uncharacterized protein
MLTKIIIPSAGLKFYDDTSAEHDIGRFTGKASVYGVVDSYGDIVMPGAFKRTLKEKGVNRPLLNQHDPSQPIGICTLIDSPSALYVDGQINLGTQLGREVHSHLEFGSIDGLSIGYSTVVAIKGKSGHRELVDLDLWEVSVVTFPACSPARVTDVKAEDSEFAEALASLAVSMHLGLTQVESTRAASRLRHLSQRAGAPPTHASTSNEERALVSARNINTLTRTLVAERRARLGF